MSGFHRARWDEGMISLMESSAELHRRHQARIEACEERIRRLERREPRLGVFKWVQRYAPWYRER